MTPTIEYTTADKTTWGDGPWQSEPDKKQWQDAETGLPCLIVRNTSVTGSLCGYVGVSKDHPAYEQHYDADPVSDVSVHGGLTFASGCSHGNPETGICHIPGDGEPDDVWWFGFDCAHAWDRAPAMDATLREIGSPNPHPEDVYRDWSYVEAEVADQAKQLKAMETVK
jgi:hypothetical protein